MFAAAKTGNGLCAIFAREVHCDLIFKIIQKKISKSIVGIKKGFYICTRLRGKAF